VVPLDIETPTGRARAELHAADNPRGALVLGHGAGGGIHAPDLQAAREAALSVHVSVALFEQPYRVAGRRSPAPAGQLDAAWLAAIEHLRRGELEGLPLITGGRSAGARVACRSAEASGALALLCLAFPLAPRRRGESQPPAARLPELEQVRVPVLIVQGSRDPFGMPPKAPQREVVAVPGDHSLRSSTAEVRDAVGDWLERVLSRAGSRAALRARTG
jgi:predicted alpha/beta-hydrolase family hydrolase